MSLDRSSPVNVTPSGSTGIDDATMADGTKRQIVAIGSGDSAGGTLVADVATSQPAGTENGLIVREAQKGQTTMASSRPVVLASDQSEIPVSTLELTAAINLNATNANVVLNATGRTAFGMVITAIGTGHAQLQVSINGTNWVALDCWNETAELWQTGDITATGSYWAEAVGPITQVRVIQISGTGPIQGTLIAGMQPAQHAEYAGNPSGAVPPVVAFVGGQDGSGNLRGLAVTTAGVVKTVLTPQTSGGVGNSFNVQLSNTPIAVKASAGQLQGYHIGNPNSTAAYVFIYNQSTVGITVGSTTSVLCLYIPANGGAIISLPQGLDFSTAITVAASTSRVSNAAPTVGLDVNLFFN